MLIGLSLQKRTQKYVIEKSVKHSAKMRACRLPDYTINHEHLLCMRNALV